ncbi:S4 domain-containing protein, partial [Mesorhizobium sp.]|uniref:S4 domain-containing protein n=1 Tax=Mesorhizobium sp. TaxID=1871066 RepID=UPI0025C069AC
MADNEAVVLEAGADAAGQRLDQWLAAKLGPDISRSRVQALIRQGAVSIAGKPVQEVKRKMAAGERVSVVMPEPEPAEPLGEDIPLD